MSVINWPTILTAIQDLFQAGSGLADTRVLFQRNAHKFIRPDGTGAWISLKFESSVDDRPALHGGDRSARARHRAGKRSKSARAHNTKHRVHRPTAFAPEENADDASEPRIALLNDVMHR
jgi:hypothetical protein